MAGFSAADRNWADSDYIETEDGRCIADGPWDKAVGKEEANLRQLVAADTLAASGRGRTLKVRLGDYDDLVGHETGAIPEDHWSYHVLPDSEAENVQRDLDGLQRLQRVLDWQPFSGSESAEAPAMPGKMILMLRETTAFQLIACWVELRTAEIVLDEIAENFGGQDVLKPVFRSRLEDAKAKLLQTREALLLINMDAVLREPLEEELVELRESVEDARSKV